MMGAGGGGRAEDGCGEAAGDATGAPALVADGGVELGDGDGAGGGDEPACAVGPGARLGATLS